MERQSNTLGTVGTILGSIGTAGALGGAAKGLLGGFGGGGVNCNGNMAKENADLRARIASLESEKYTDGKFEALANRTLQEQKDFYNYVLGIEHKVDDLKGDYRVLQNDYQHLVAKVDENAKATNQGFGAVNSRINAITKVFVPGSAVCNDTDNCCNGNQ